MFPKVMFQTLNILFISGIRSVKMFLVKWKNKSVDRFQDRSKRKNVVRSELSIGFSWKNIYQISIGSILSTRSGPGWTRFGSSTWNLGLDHFWFNPGFLVLNFVIWFAQFCLGTAVFPSWTKYSLIEDENLEKLNIKFPIWHFFIKDWTPRPVGWGSKWGRWAGRGRLQVILHCDWI